MPEHKVKDFLRKLAHRKDTEDEHAYGSAHTEPSSPRKSGLRQSTDLDPRRSLQKELPPTPARQNHEALRPSVEHRREPLSHEAKPRPVYAVKKPASFPSPVVEPSEPVSSQSHEQSVSPANDGATARSESSAMHSSKISAPGLSNNERSNPVADSVAHDYEAYQPILSSTSDPRDGGNTHTRNQNIVDRNTAAGRGSQEQGDPDQLASDHKERLRAEGVDLDDSVDTDKSVKVAPAVTHEVVKPHVHHVREERIHREIHEHDVYHRIQPVYETEVLPARHFVIDPNSDGFLEVSEDQLPDCTGANQRWLIGERQTLPSSRKPMPQITQPKITDEKTYMTPEGFERKETLILHPPTLEDMSGYKGPVYTVNFPETPGSEASADAAAAETVTPERSARTTATSPTSTHKTAAPKTSFV